MGPHGDLQRDLAAHLREAGYLTFTEIQAYPGRLDVVALKPSYSPIDIRVYEVKARRADLLSGLASAKYEQYKDCGHRLYFAIPRGLAKPEELPPEVGLIVKGKTWRHVRQPRRNPDPKHVTINFVCGLLFRGYEEHRVARDLRTMFSYGGEDGLDYRQAATRAGHKVSRYLQRQEVLVEPLRSLHELIRERFPENHGEYAVDSLVSRLTRMLDVLDEVENNTKVMQQIGQYIAGFGSFWSTAENMLSARKRVEATLEEVLES